MRSRPSAEGLPVWNYGAIIPRKGVFRPGTIMNRAFHTGIVLALVIHMLYGCCVHHAHAHGGPSETKALAIEASCACHHAIAGPGQACDDTSQHQACGGDRCVFTRPDSDDAPDLSIGHGCLDPVCVSPGIAMLSVIDRVDSSLDNLGEPVPLHLLNQAFLL